jgi:hypothetical protein
MPSGRRAHRNMPPVRGVPGGHPGLAISAPARPAWHRAAALYRARMVGTWRSRKPSLHHLHHHALVEAGRVQVGRLLGLQQLGIHGFGRHHESPAAGRAPAPWKMSPGRCSRRGCARSMAAAGAIAKPQVAIGVVFDDRQASSLRALDSAARRASVMVRPVGFWKLGSTYRKRARCRSALPALAAKSSTSMPSSSLATLTTSGSIGINACSAPR